MQKTMSLLIGLTFALGGLAALGPAAYAQTANDLVITDPPGDAVLAPGIRQSFVNVEPAATPATIPADLAGPADLTGFKVHGETATTLSFEFSVADFGKVNTAWQPQNVFYFLCFEYSATGGQYRFLFDFSYRTQPEAEANIYPEFSRGILQRMIDDDCHVGFDERSLTTPTSVSVTKFAYEYLPAEGRMTWTLPRSAFQELTTTGANDENRVLDPLPVAGDKLANVQMFAITKSAVAFLTYDSTASGDFEFSMDTGNELVRVHIPSTVRSTVGVGGLDTPIYGVEIGGFQTVPITIENDLPNPIEPTIAVTILSGEASKWQVRTLPSIGVPAKVGDEPGRAMVTLIVNADPIVKHKEMVRLLVTALDEEYPHLGAQAIDVVAVAPPTPSSRTLYFHGTGDPCRNSDRWLNTLPSDVDSKGSGIHFRVCDPEGGGAAAVSGGEIGVVFRPDVPFARDYVLSTDEPARATLFFSSTKGLGGSDPQRVGVPMVADVTLQILSGSVVIGESTETVTLNEDPSGVDFQVDILPRMLGGFGREIPNDRGLRLRVAVEAASRTIEVGGCIQGVPECIPVMHQNVPSPPGDVYLNFGQSRIDLPIVSSERSGDLINITESGALMSLRVSQGERHVFTNPGRIVVFNLTVQNEGVNLDSARIDLVLNQTGWRAEVLPRNEFRLDVGEPRSFNVRITAPADGREGQTLRVDVYAKSLNDSQASTRLPLTIEITTGQQFEDQEIDPRLQFGEEEKGSPGPHVVLLLGILALLGAAMRRRR